MKTLLTTIGRWSAVIASAVLGFATAPPLSAQIIQTQAIALDSAWNLISFQVVPANPAPAAVFGTLGADFVAAWTFDNQTKQWIQYAHPASAQAIHNAIRPMPNIEVGRAYWVYMTAPRHPWNMVGLPNPTTPGLTFSNGWNLVGIPTGTGTLPESVNMLSVLAVSGLNYDAILKWEANQYKKFTPDDQDVDDFTTFDANKGHWVHITSNSFVLQPRLVSTVLPDVDAEPRGNFPSFEDVEISESTPLHQVRTPLGPTNQTHIAFFPGDDKQTLGIGNVGGGILLWDIQWAPRDAANASWLVLSATKGVTTIENDVITLSLDRKNLVQGVYRGTLTLRTTAGNRSFEVVANVPGVSGEWRGRALIDTVNGHRNEVPNVDLHLDFYEDPSIPGLIRGLIDSRNALLWPVDVPLIGHVTSAQGNSFSMGGAYLLPPGDQNNPPYDQFNPTAEDVDWNCNGKVDAVNPFPFPVYRALSMVGQLTSASPSTGYVIEGTYQETVYGMMRHPIQLLGTFSVTRASVQPFANRRPIKNLESTNRTQPVVLRSVSPNVPISGHQSVMSSLTFLTDMVLQDVLVDVDLDGRPADLKLTVQSPSGQEVVLHDHANISTLRGMSFPSLRQPKQPLNDFVNSGGAPTDGAWTLFVENSGSSLATLVSWSLQIQGQPVFDVAGRVTAAGNAAGLPAQVFLDGLPISETSVADQDGNFTFYRIPGIPLNFSASLAGYQPANDAMPGLLPGFTTPDYSATACVSSEKTRLAAGFRPLPGFPVPPLAADGFRGSLGTVGDPLVLQLRPSTNLGTAVARGLPGRGAGGASSTVYHCNPTNRIAANALISWNFGDGSAPISGIGLFSTPHTYSTVRATGYLATVSFPGGSANAQVYVMASPSNSPYAYNFFQCGFTGGGTIPTNYGLLITGTNNTNQAQFANLLMVQHADCASFDIDRAPSTTDANRDFNSDGFTNGMASVNSADFMGNFKGEDSNYTVEPGTGAGQWEFAAQCGFFIDDNIYHPYPKQGALGDCALPHYRMICNVGPQMLPVSYDLVSSSGGPLLGNVAGPPAEAIADGIAKARELRMVTGPLAWAWQEGASR